MIRTLSVAIVSLGLNLIYGFNGQFSLGQWGFYAIGAYAGADITYRWIRGDMAGLAVVAATIVLGILLLTNPETTLIAFSLVLGGW